MVLEGELISLPCPDNNTAMPLHLRHHVLCLSVWQLCIVIVVMGIVDVFFWLQGQQPSSFLGCLTFQQQAIYIWSQRCISFMCCHTEKEIADETIYLTQSHYTDSNTGKASPKPNHFLKLTHQHLKWTEIVYSQNWTFLHSMTLYITTAFLILILKLEVWGSSLWWHFCQWEY